MIKWIIVIAAAGWISLNVVAGMELGALLAYRDHLLALGIALMLQPWFVRQLGE